MADMTRTDTSIITLTGENESYQRRALEAAIAYQDAMGIPCIFASGEKEQLLTEYGFGTVLKLPSYRINQELLSDSLLLQARISGSIEFVPSLYKDCSTQTKRTHGAFTFCEYCIMQKIWVIHDQRCCIL